MTGRPPSNKRRLAELRMLRFCRGWLTTAEMVEARRLAKVETQCARRRERYANDPDYRERTRGRILAWQRSKREAG